MSVSKFPERVCCVASYHDGSDKESVVRVSLVVTDTTVAKGFKILESREWWVSKMDLDEIHEEVDFHIGRLKTARTVVLHVEGLVPLQKDGAHYKSSLVTHRDLLQLMRDEPERFRL